MLPAPSSSSVLCAASCYECLTLALNSSMLYASRTWSYIVFPSHSQIIFLFSPLTPSSLLSRTLERTLTTDDNVVCKYCNPWGLLPLVFYQFIHHHCKQGSTFNSSYCCLTVLVHDFHHPHKRSLLDLTSEHRTFFLGTLSCTFTNATKTQGDWLRCSSPSTLEKQTSHRTLWNLTAAVERPLLFLTYLQQPLLISS